MFSDSRITYPYSELEDSSFEQWMKSKAADEAIRLYSYRINKIEKFIEMMGYEYHSEPVGWVKKVSPKRDKK